MIGFRTRPPQSVDAGGGEDEDGDLDGARSDSGEAEMGKRWVA